ncbi:IPT/TIG domain-containing protein [Streptomyces sp. GC420]|uniref:IPT/TIG domain-containing protein n=1 Tax=Streptomyces sp. GC420 TaxID=2697568 RepID=UPI001414F254|nr:IPT/TIG domain-containing protein [Streptomyces sp. GC420]NBM17905.1 cell surface receptor IPT/TIG domain-containing protein [Streptomyces sp. GC420]
MSTPLLPGLLPGLGSPTLFAVVPGFGPTAGGNQVLLIGANLSGATSVTFGGTPATILSQDPLGIFLTVRAPAHAAGNVAVVVTTPAGASGPANYTYIGPPAPQPPTVLALSPQSGPTTGGTPFAIVGTNLTGATVTFDGVAATNVNVLAGVILTGVTPPHAAGNVPVVVTTPAGSATVPGGFTYLAPTPPTATSITPTSGPVAGGTPFAIVGSNLTGASVTVGGVAATGVLVDATGTVLFGITPAGAAGNAAVVVTTPAGSANVAGGFTYV